MRRSLIVSGLMLPLGRDMDVIPVDGSRAWTSRQMKADRSFPASREGVRQAPPTRSGIKKGRRARDIIAGVINNELCCCGGVRGSRCPCRNRVGLPRLQAGHILIDASHAAFGQAMRSDVGAGSTHTRIYFPYWRPWREITIFEARIRNGILKPCLGTHQHRAEPEISLRRAQDKAIQVVAFSGSSWTLLDTSRQLRRYYVSRIRREWL